MFRLSLKPEKGVTSEFIVIHLSREPTGPQASENTRALLPSMKFRIFPNELKNGPDYFRIRGPIAPALRRREIAIGDGAKDSASSPRPTARPFVMELSIKRCREHSVALRVRRPGLIRRTFSDCHFGTCGISEAAYFSTFLAFEAGALGRRRRACETDQPRGIPRKSGSQVKSRRFTAARAGTNRRTAWKEVS